MSDKASDPVCPGCNRTQEFAWEFDHSEWCWDCNRCELDCICGGLNVDVLIENLQDHADHRVVTATYIDHKGDGDIVNFALECEYCNVVIFDHDVLKEMGKQ